MKPIYRLLFIGLLLALAQLACGSLAPGVDPVASSEPYAPVPVPTRQTSPSAAETAVPPQPGVSESRMLTVEFPPRIRAGDSELIRLTLEVDHYGNLTATAETAGNITQGEIIQIPNIYATHAVYAEARLDLAGVQVNPPGVMSESLRPGQPITFYWSVRAQDVGIYRGTLWFYLRYIPLDGGPEQRLALSAQKVEIEAVNFFGLKAQPARWMGAGGMVVSFVLGKPLFTSVLKWLWGRARKSRLERQQKKK